jgi:hypothetical protein
MRSHAECFTCGVRNPLIPKRSWTQSNAIHTVYTHISRYLGQALLLEPIHTCRTILGSTRANEKNTHCNYSSNEQEFLSNRQSVLGSLKNRQLWLELRQRLLCGRNLGNAACYWLGHSNASSDRLIIAVCILRKRNYQQLSNLAS